MKILINTSKLRFGGAIQVAVSFIYECRNFTENEYHVFVGQGVGKSLRKKDFPANFYFYDFNFGTVTLRKIPAISSELSRYEKQIKPDCVVTTSGPSYWHSTAPHLMGFNLGIHIYFDSPYFKTISTYRKLKLYFKRKIHFLFFRRDASAYLVQTDDVNQRVRKALKTNKVYTVSNTHNSFFNNFVRYEINLPPRVEGEIRFLTLSSYYKHKNIEIIPSVIKELNQRGLKNVKFLLTLENSTFNEIFKNSDTKDIVNVGPVKPEECPTLYSECDYMFMPSLAECFSASYPEAMVMQKPIITTDLPFARNICDNAALYYAPMDGKSAADTIESVIKNEELRNTLINNGLHRLRSFDNASERAGKILEICKILKKDQS
jgi:glycosyltransferase involved in cell wall biosynthesis